MKDISIMKGLVLCLFVSIYSKWYCKQEIKWKTLSCKLKGMTVSEKRIVCTLNNLDVITSAYTYYFFEKICRLAYWGFERIRNFPGYGRPGIKLCRNTCRNTGYRKFPGFGSKHHTQYIISQHGLVVREKYFGISHARGHRFRTAVSKAWETFGREDCNV